MIHLIRNGPRFSAIPAVVFWAFWRMLALQDSRFQISAIPFPGNLLSDTCTLATHR